MLPTIELSFCLPLPQAEQVLAFVRSLNPTERNSNLPLQIPLTTKGLDSGTDGSPGNGTILSFTPSPLQELRYLLDDRLQQVIRFAVQKTGRFYNDELATELGVDDPETSTFLGHLTRKLRKTGVSAEGFRGTNWYSKVRSSGRTLITVRSDVLLAFTKALEK